MRTCFPTAGVASDYDGRHPITPDQGAPMAVPTQLAAFDHREFRVVIGRVGGRFVARAWNRSRKHLAEVKGSARADVEAEMRCHLNAISENYIGLNGAINLFRRAFPGGFGCPYYAFREREYKDARARAWLPTLWTRSVYAG